PVLDLVGEDALLLIDESERVRRRAHDLVATTSEFLEAAWVGAAAGGSVPLSGGTATDLSAASFSTLADARQVASARGLGWWTLSSFGQDTELAESSDDVASD